MKTKVYLFIISLFSVIILSCSGQEANSSGETLNLEGCWVGGLLKNNSLTEDIELRLISRRADSTLAISLIYELGPRSRVWEYNTEITCRGREISWLAHKGYLGNNPDTMYLSKSWKGEKTEWMFYRDKSYDPFIEQFLSNRTDDYFYTIPEERGDSIHTGSLADVGFDTDRVTDFIKEIKSGNHGDIHSILIFRSGRLVLEEYFALNGKISGPFINKSCREKLHQLSSVTKGILSIATGIAIDRGFIKGVDEPIASYLPRYAGSFTGGKEQIEVKHLLTMTSGLDWRQFNIGWDDPRNNAAEMYRCNDVVGYVLERPLGDPPGQRFNYTNGEPVVMGAILRNGCAMEQDKFTGSLLFGPLGIAQYRWSRYPDGTLETDGGLKLKSRDLLKVGLLMLSNGRWQGSQVVSEEWISESTVARIAISPRRGYGYYWNTMKYNFRGTPGDAIFIPGDGGQFMALFPTLDMVIVFTAGIYDKDPTALYWGIINRHILPALK